MTTSLRLNYAALSDRGLVRSNNEDSAYAGPNLLILADGMGGHAAGEVASQIMVNRLARLDADPEDNDMLALLGGVADDANQEIADTVRARPETEGMGCTCTALMFNGEVFGLLHVGDSRGYRLRGGKLQQITEDDTYVQSLVNEGKLAPEDVSTHPQKSLILKAYTGRPVEPTLETLDIKVGDRLLLCSDGLSDPVTHSTIEDTLAKGSPSDAAHRLIELALRSGGPDNVTVIVAEVVEGGGAEGLPTTPALAGALLADAPEDDHPDTAAGRAALLNRAPKEIPAAATIDDREEQADEEKKSLLPGIIVSLVLIIGLIAGGWWAYSSVDKTYFLATGDKEQIIIEKGVDYSVFGRDLHSPYQAACLSKDGELGLVALDQADGKGCDPFTLSALPESVRTQVTNLDSGSYDEITQQLRRLTDQALPVCLSKQDKKEGNCREVAK